MCSYEQFDAHGQIVLIQLFHPNQEQYISIKTIKVILISLYEKLL